MSIPRISQGHKVAVITAPDEASPVRVAQGHKILLFNPGSSPMRVAQGHLVVVFTPDPATPPAAGRRRGFMSF